MPEDKNSLPLSLSRPNLGKAPQFDPQIAAHCSNENIIV